MRAVFLDRDGTLIEEAGYLERLDRLIFFPFAVDAVRQLNRAGFLIVVNTNQSGVARGIVSEEFVSIAHQQISRRLQAGGARVDAYYHCPHHPEGIVASLRTACECRKPQPGMLRRAAADLHIDLRRSFSVGDRWHDVDAGQAAGTRTVLVRTGHGASVERTRRDGPAPDVIVDNVAAAAAWILTNP